MRLLLNLWLKPGVVLPFDYQDALRSTLHRWLGRNNELHDTPHSLYSFGPIQGVKAAHGGLVETNAGVHWQLAFYNQATAWKVLEAAYKDRTEIMPGLRVYTLGTHADPAQIPTRLQVLSPVLVQDWENKRGTTRDHLLPDNPRHTEALTTSLRHKLAAAGLSDSGCTVRMLPSFKTKLIRIKNLSYRCAVAPVEITGTDEQRHFARTVGIGHSTGCGFGFLE